MWCSKLSALKKSWAVTCMRWFSLLCLRWCCALLPAPHNRQRITACSLWHAVGHVVGAGDKVAGGRVGCMRQGTEPHWQELYSSGSAAATANSGGHARHAVTQSWDGGGHIYQFTCWILVEGESQPAIILSQMTILYQLLKTRIYYAFYEPFPNDMRAPVRFCPLASSGLLVWGILCWSRSCFTGIIVHLTSLG